MTVSDTTPVSTGWGSLPRRTILLLFVSAACIATAWMADFPPCDRVTAAAPATEQAAIAFTAEGAPKLPENFREWIFIGAPVTPHDMNDGQAAFPEFHNVYIDPGSYAAYKRTGQFREGTVILKELVSVGGKALASGNGYFQGEFISLEAMIKDQGRFSGEPGGWAFFRFGEAPHYRPVGTRMKTESCNACHAGGDQDYVFTSTYPVLRAARPPKSP